MKFEDYVGLQAKKNPSLMRSAAKEFSEMRRLIMMNYALAHYEFPKHRGPQP
jgi:hypothetical protein